jgi:hypothetical protein
MARAGSGAGAKTRRAAKATSKGLNEKNIIFPSLTAENSSAMRYAPQEMPVALFLL